MTHWIMGIGIGCTETMLYQTLMHHTESYNQYKVICLGASHYYENRIKKFGIPMVELLLRS